MKQLKISLLSIVTIIFCGFIDVHAASASLSVSSNKVYVGDSFTVFVNINQSAAWNIHVNSSGPVSGCVINDADATKNALNTSKQLSATCTATQEGNINISLSGDVTNATDGNYADVSGSAIVNVTLRPQTNNNNNHTEQQTTKTEKNESTNNKTSKNCNLKSISVEGYQLEKIDANNYALTVSNNISTININTLAEDKKATVEGTGTHTLEIGTNNIEVLIISESGNKNKINLKVIRKEEMDLEELDESLKSDAKIIEINNNTNRNISSQELSKIKSSGKTVVLNHKVNGNLKYSWIINGKEIDDFDELFTEVQFESKNKKKISELSNYAEGIYLSFKQSSSFPDGVKLKAYVKDKYTDGSKVNIYYYDNQKMVLHKEKVKVKDGYILFDIDKSYDHIITMSTITLTDKEKNTTSKIIIPIVIIVSITIGVIGIISMFVAKKKSKPKQKEEFNEEVL